MLQQFDKKGFAKTHTYNFGICGPIVKIFIPFDLSCNSELIEHVIDPNCYSSRVPLSPMFRRNVMQWDKTAIAVAFFNSFFDTNYDFLVRKCGK